MAVDTTHGDPNRAGSRHGAPARPISGGRARAAACVAIAALVALATLPASSFAITVRQAQPPTSLSVNGPATYTAQGRTARNETATSATFTFPANTDLSGVSTSTVSAVELPAPGLPVTISGVTVVGNTVTVALSLSPDTKSDTFNVTVGGVRNPSQPGGYTYAVDMVGSDGPDSRTSAAFALTANATTVTVGTVSLSSTVASQPLAVTMPVTLGANGRLAGTTAAGANQITVTLPDASMMPTGTPPAGSVTIDGVAPAAVAIAGTTVTLTLAAGQTLAYGATFDVAFAEVFGLRAPAVPGTYAIAASTTAESGTGTGPSFTITEPPFMTLTIDTAAIDFGVLEPEVPSATSDVTVTVATNIPYTFSRALAGDVASMGLAFTGVPDGAKPAGASVYVDTFQATPPWATEPGVPLSVSVQYTVVP